MSGNFSGPTDRPGSVGRKTNRSYQAGKFRLYSWGDQSPNLPHPNRENRRKIKNIPIQQRIAEQNLNSQTNDNFADATFEMENLLNPKPFHGSQLEDSENWWLFLEDWFAFKGWARIPALPTGATAEQTAANNALKAEGERKIKAFFPLIFREGAADWFRTLPEGEKDTLATVKTSFKARYSPDSNKHRSIVDVWRYKQMATQSVDNYFDGMKKLARIAGTSEDANLIHAIINGLRPEIRKEVILQNPADIKGVLTVARRAEQAMRTTILDEKPGRETLNELAGSEINPLKGEIKEGAFGGRSPSPSRNMQRVHFEEGARPKENVQSKQPFESYRPRFSGNQATRLNQYQPRQPYTENQNFSQSQPMFRPQQNQAAGRGQSNSQIAQNCGNCARRHEYGRCPAFGVQCYGCGRLNHFSRTCRATQRGQGPSKSSY